MFSVLSSDEVTVEGCGLSSAETVVCSDEDMDVGDYLIDITICEKNV